MQRDRFFFLISLKCECLNDSIACHISFQMAKKLTKDFDELIQTYEEDLNEMLLKGPLRIGLVVKLHSKVGRTEYLKTATSCSSSYIELE